MRFNYKKISAIATSVLLTGLTVSAASAVSNPADLDNPAVVYGAESDDSTSATGLGNYISENTEDSTTTEVSEESIQLQRSSDEFNLGENMTDFYNSLDSEELGEILEDGEYLNDDNDDFEYEQNFALSENAQLVHFRDRDYEEYEPTVGFHFTKGELIGNYTLEFTPDAAVGGTDFEKLKNTYLTILGKEYYISDAANDGSEITLLDSANDASLNEGESTQVSVDGQTYDVEISFISDGQVKLNVNGEETNTLDAGETYKLSDESYVSIQDLLVQNYEGGSKKVTFSIGNGKISLIDGEEVEINGDAVSQIDEYDGHVLNAYLSNNTDNEMETISLEWLADDDLFLTAESDLILPAMGDIKFSMSGLELPAEEKTTFGTGDPFSVTTQVEDGEVSIDLFYLNDTEDGFANNLGASEAQHLITNATGGEDGSTVDLSLVNETYFVASWKSGRDAETYVYELSNIKDNSGKNETTIENLADGSTQVFKEIGDDNDVGRLRMTLTDADESAETATIKVEPISGGSAYTDRVFTAEGLQFTLPVMDNGAASATSTQEVDLINETTWDMNFTEENEDGDIEGGESFHVNISIDSNDGIEADGLSPDFTKQIGRTGDSYVGYKESKLATRVDWEQETSGLDAMEITYAGEESFAEVYISSTVTESTSDSGSVVLKDTDDYSGRDVIIVGGSCINSAAADVLTNGEALCGEDFTAETGVKDGEFILKGSEDDDGNVVVVAAGYREADTRRAVNLIQDEDFDEDLSSVDKVYTVSDAEEITEAE